MGPRMAGRIESFYANKEEREDAQGGLEHVEVSAGVFWRGVIYFGVMCAAV